MTTFLPYQHNISECCTLRVLHMLLWSQFKETPFRYYRFDLKVNIIRLIGKKTQAADVQGWTSVAVPRMARSDRCRLKAHPPGTTDVPLVAFKVAA